MKYSENAGFNVKFASIMLSYALILSRDSNGTLLVEFPDVPNALTVGVDQEDALTNAVDALESAFEIYIDEGKRVPLPVSTGQAEVTMPAQTAAKVLLWNEMLDQHLTTTELARRLALPVPELARLFDISHSTSIDLIEKAARALGKRFHFQLKEDLAPEALSR
jgi:antitoxin HicB